MCDASPFNRVGLIVTLQIPGTSVSGFFVNGSVGGFMGGDAL